MALGRFRDGTESGWDNFKIKWDGIGWFPDDI